MRFREINERMAEHVYDPQEMVDVLVRDCGPYLDEINGQVATNIMFRGIQGRTAPGFGKETARLSGRKPLSTRSDMHEYINQFFVEHFEHPFRDGIFATGSWAQAKEYSHGGESPYVIFPIGDFDYLWHENVDDMYNWIASTAPTGLPALMDRMLPGFRQDGLAEALKIPGGREIMLWCEEYYYMELPKMKEIGKFLQ